MSKSTDKNKEKDYYLILGANKDETISDIKKKYLKLAIKYHPDKSRNGEDTTEMYELITQAWSVLGNEKKRKEYDKTQNIQKTDHFSIKYEFENFFDLQHKEKPNLEMRKLEFDKINA
jgi:curved DNA-binding protein CbpA